jgi:hypothetical protein
VGGGSHNDVGNSRNVRNDLLAIAGAATATGYRQRLDRVLLICPD